MDTKQEIKLSSNWTNAGLYGGAIAILIIVPILLFMMTTQEFHAGMMLGILILIALVGFQIYLFKNVCDARVVGETLVLKKQFRPAMTYTFDQIGYLISFRLKSTKYTIVNMEGKYGSSDKYLIMNSKSILAFEKKDAKEVLRTIRRLAMDKAK